MKKIVLLILIVFLLTSCSNIQQDEVEVINVDYDEISEIRIRTFTNGLTIDPDKEWSDFVDTMVMLEYESISKSEVEDIFEKESNFFVITLVMNDGYRKFFVYDNNVITYNLENINDDLEKVELLRTSHNDIAILFAELSEIDFPSNTVLMKKPVIYIYPEEAIELNLSLESDCAITTSYPKYENGWNVFVEPNGVITDYDGKRYSYLYWEGEIDFEDQFDDGFIVIRENTIEFLEEKLEKLGLNFQERNDFITYWLPELEKHKYNKIRFLGAEYEKLVKLNITPEPDTLIRVFMIFKGLEELEEITEQIIEPIQRFGYTVVDWGGAEIK